MNKPLIKTSVRELVEYVLREGDIDTNYFQRSRGVEGTKAHKKIQRSRGGDYEKEVSVSIKVEKEKCLFEIGGRMDGVFTKEGIPTIEEIKTTLEELNRIQEPKGVHLAQAKCYAYIYAKQKNKKTINVQVTYYNIETKQTKIFVKKYLINELGVYINSLIDNYIDWALRINDWQKKRDCSIAQLKFPFKEYRKGQEKLIQLSEQTIKEEKKLFIQAPTGIGKTVAILYPAIKAVREKGKAKIFYLTAKTTAKEIAEKTIEIMRKKGLKLKTVTITAKAKICFKEKNSCDPIYCEFAKGHFNRINDAIRDIFSKENFSHKTIIKYAKKHKVCPFEFSLELALIADCVICDYNYVFDPRVYLRRFFAFGQTEFIFLIDEAHNLVERARAMFSAELWKKDILELKRETKETHIKLSKNLAEINKYMIKARKKCEEEGGRSYIQKELPTARFISLLRKFCYLAENWLELNRKTEFREKMINLYFELKNFLRVVEEYDERYITYYEKSNKDLRVKLFCLDPSYLLNQALERGKTVIFFSATLTPLRYFTELLGGDKETTMVQLPSPFPQENMLIMLEDKISTKYVEREQSYEKITELIMELVKGKVGNYLIYFPSYEYMERVYETFEEKKGKEKRIKQERGMTEKERKRFLEEFVKYGKETLVGFAVMGGVFSEGIDLVGEKLSGAVVVGVGLPKICLERELIKRYFEEKKGRGFNYAYTYPGMNKVLQAVGRVIRTKEDKGVILLIDKRFAIREYKELYPRHWEKIERIENKKEMKKKIEKFWGGERRKGEI
ncbi:MAG: ATP-dependent DNA helicase [Candidatus Heimdallarchaeaceae archaeon]